jgi:hypothetical protein
MDRRTAPVCAVACEAAKYTDMNMTRKQYRVDSLGKPTIEPLSETTCIPPSNSGAENALLTLQSVRSFLCVRIEPTLRRWMKNASNRQHSGGNAEVI